MDKICMQCELVFNMDQMIKGKDEVIRGKDASLLLKDGIIKNQRAQIDKLKRQVLALSQLSFHFNPN